MNIYVYNNCASLAKDDCEYLEKCSDAASEHEFDLDPESGVEFLYNVQKEIAEFCEVQLNYFFEPHPASNKFYNIEDFISLLMDIEDYCIQHSDFYDFEPIVFPSDVFGGES